MIAVFTRNAKFFKNNYKCHPYGMFVNVNTPNDLRGRKFTGVIEADAWFYRSESDSVSGHADKIKAYEILKGKQPELFK